MTAVINSQIQRMFYDKEPVSRAWVNKSQMWPIIPWSVNPDTIGERVTHMLDWDNNICLVDGERVSKLGYSTLNGDIITLNMPDVEPHLSQLNVMYARIPDLVVTRGEQIPIIQFASGIRYFIGNPLDFGQAAISDVFAGVVYVDTPGVGVERYSQVRRGQELTVYSELNLELNEDSTTIYRYSAIDASIVSSPAVVGPLPATFRFSGPVGLQINRRILKAYAFAAKAIVFTRQRPRVDIAAEANTEGTVGRYFSLRSARDGQGMWYEKPVWKDPDWLDNSPSVDDPNIHQNADLAYNFSLDRTILGGQEYVMSDLLNENTGEFTFTTASDFITYLFLKFGASFRFSPANVYELPTVVGQFDEVSIQTIFDNDSEELDRFKVYAQVVGEPMIYITNGRTAMSLGSFVLGQPVRIAYTLWRKTETGGPNEGKTYTHIAGAVNGSVTKVLSTELVAFGGEEYSHFLTDREGTQPWQGPVPGIRAVSWLDANGYHDYQGSGDNANRWASRVSMQDPFISETPIPQPAPPEPETGESSSSPASTEALSPAPLAAPLPIIERIEATGYRWRSAGGTVSNQIGNFNGRSYQFQTADGLVDIDYLVIEAWDIDRSQPVALSFAGVSLSDDIRGDFKTRTTVRYPVNPRASGHMASGVGATSGLFVFYKIYGERVTEPETLTFNDDVYTDEVYQ